MKRIKTVGDLKRLLGDIPDDCRVAVVPDGMRPGRAMAILDRTGKSSRYPGLIVLELDGMTYRDDGRELAGIVWKDGDK